MENLDNAWHARFGGGRTAPESRMLTTDATVRHITLTEGSYRLFGSAAQFVFYTTRACKADGTLESTAVVAPSTAQLNTPTAGTPGAGLAWDTGVGSGSVNGGASLPKDVKVWEVITVRRGTFANLYVSSPGGATVAELVGPFES